MGSPPKDDKIERLETVGCCGAVKSLHLPDDTETAFAFEQAGLIVHSEVSVSVAKIE